MKKKLALVAIVSLLVAAVYGGWTWNGRSATSHEAITCTFPIWTGYSWTLVTKCLPPLVEPEG